MSYCSTAGFHIQRLFHVDVFYCEVDFIIYLYAKRNPRLGLTYLSFRVPKQTTDFSTSPLLSVAMARLWVRNMEDHHRLNRCECLYYGEDDDEQEEGEYKREMGQDMFEATGGEDNNKEEGKKR